jgi:branched-chain amino acid transport system substrate-binding protein
MKLTRGKRIGIIVGALIIVLVILYVVKRPRQQVIRIGADITTSGQFAYFGQKLQRGLQLAAEEAKTQGPATEIVFQDNQHDMKQTVTIFDRFVTLDHVSAVVSIYSPPSLALRETAARQRIPLITTYTTAKDLPSSSEWVFRDFPRMEDQMPPLADYALKDLKVSHAACIGFNTDFGRDGCQAFSGSFTKEGGQMPSTPEFVALDVSDVRPAILKVLASKPEAVVLILSAKPLGQAVKNLRELNYKGPIFGAIMFDSPEVWEAAGDAANDVFFPSVAFDLTRPDYKSFVSAYRDRFNNEDPDYVSIYGYTIGQYLLKAVKDANGDPTKIKDILKTLDTDSIRGRIRVQPTRDISSPLAIYKRMGGKNEFVRVIAQ